MDEWEITMWTDDGLRLARSFRHCCARTAGREWATHELLLIMNYSRKDCAAQRKATDLIKKKDLLVCAVAF